MSVGSLPSTSLCACLRPFITHTPDVTLRESLARSFIATFRPETCSSTYTATSGSLTSASRALPKSQKRRTVSSRASSPTLPLKSTALVRPSVSSDVYAVGVVVYQLLTGKNPFTGAHMSDTIARVLNETPPLASSRRQDIPEVARRGSGAFSREKA